ncbi:MAG: DUF4124 domain-containing protein [Lysobacterales bacterium]
MGCWSAAYAGAADKVYRWVDAAGVTHFDARPPADGQQTESAGAGRTALEAGGCSAGCAGGGLSEIRWTRS